MGWLEIDGDKVASLRPASLGPADTGDAIIPFISRAALGRPCLPYLLQLPAGLAQAIAHSLSGPRSGAAMHASYLNTIKRFEGFSARTQWDYAQNTNGYGTKAQFAGEKISVVEAERRFHLEISRAELLVDGFAPGLEEGMRAALTSLTFNVGTAWMHAGLGNAVQRGDANEVRRIFLQYNRAGGEILPGLTARRREEAAWMSIDDVQLATPRSETRLAEISGEARHLIAPVVPGDGLAKLSSGETASTTSAQHCDAQAFYEQIKRDQLRLLTLRHEKLRDDTFAVPEPLSCA